MVFDALRSDRPRLPPAVARGGPSVLGFMVGALLAGLMVAGIPFLLGAGPIPLGGGGRTVATICAVAIGLGSCGLIGHLAALMALGPLAREGEGTLAGIGLLAGLAGTAGGLTLLWLHWLGAILAPPLLAWAVGRVLLARARRRGRIARHVPGAHCATCGYLLSDIRTGRCPECGAVTGRAPAPAPTRPTSEGSG